jgi:hypothetical protein
MYRYVKLLLASSLITLPLGIFVSVTNMPHSPVSYIILPAGIGLFGFSLLALIFGRDFSRPIGTEKLYSPEHRRELGITKKQEERISTGRPSRHAYS